ncbi:unnamed protein product [Cochlearia groenlandica]
MFNLKFHIVFPLEWTPQRVSGASISAVLSSDLLAAEMNITRFVFCTSFDRMLRRSEPPRSMSVCFSGMLRRFVDRRDKLSQVCSLLVDGDKLTICH